MPTVYNPIRSQNSIQFPVPGNLTVRVKLLAFDKFHNISDFTEEATITTGRDTTRPAAPTNLIAIASIKSIDLLWTPPPDADYAYAEVWSHTSNNRAGAQKIGQGAFSFHHELPTIPNDTRFYWIISVDTSGNFSTDWYPAGRHEWHWGHDRPNRYDRLSVVSPPRKLLAGMLNVLVSLASATIFSSMGLTVRSTFSITRCHQRNRVIIGKLGDLSTQWGIQIAWRSWATHVEFCDRGDR